MLEKESINNKGILYRDYIINDILYEDLREKILGIIFQHSLLTTSKPKASPKLLGSTGTGPQEIYLST